MTVSIEPLTAIHLDSPALKYLMRGFPSALILPLEASGGIAQAILHSGTTVGILTVTVGREAMIAIHPDYQRKGIALAAVNLAKVVAIKRQITWVVAKALVGRPSNGLLDKVGAVETGRTEKEIFYRINFSDV